MLDLAYVDDFRKYEAHSSRVSEGEIWAVGAYVFLWSDRCFMFDELRQRENGLVRDSVQRDRKNALLQRIIS